MAEKINHSKIYSEFHKFLTEKTSSEYFFSLCYILNSLSLKDYILCLSDYSDYFFQLNNIQMCLKIGKELLEMFINKKEEIIKNESYIKPIFKTLYNSIKLLIKEKKEDLIIFYFLLVTEQIIEENSELFDDDLLKEIYKLNDEYNKKIENKLNKIKEEQFSILIKKDEKNYEFNEEKKKNFYSIYGIENNKISDTDDSELKNGEAVYLISNDWIRIFFGFINLLNNLKDDANDFHKFLELGFSLNGYFGNFIGNGEEINKFSFIGPVNNYFIIKDEDFWEDNDQEEYYKNIFLIEEEYYFKIQKDIWEKFKNIFGFINEIKRFSFNNEIEINLIKLKILILNKEIKENSISDIREKYIQISKYDTIENFKEKIKRCIKYKFPNFSFENKNIKIYKSNDNNELSKFSLLLSYFLNLPNYTYKCEEITDLTDKKNLENIPTLIIEIENEKDEFIIPLNKKICNKCKSELTNFEIKCDKNFSCVTLYCCLDCKNNDENHINFHKELEKYYKRKTRISDLKKISFEKLYNSKNKKHGLTGLINLGNTCFMNSAIQCLSNCTLLTKYFISGIYLQEINKKNKLGTKGEVAKAYANLLEHLWKGNESYLSPSQFRGSFIQFAKKFSGFAQQDSNEFLTYILDKLHEDLNQVTKKPYIEMKEKEENESDEKASKRWWNCYRQREDSLIVDLFHGQYKNRIICPECNKISINFDPFMFLSLSIPSGTFNINLIYCFFNENNEMLNFNNINTILTQNSTSEEMKEKIISEINHRKFTKKTICGDDIELVLFDNNYKFKKILKNNEYVFQYFSVDYHIIGYEKIKDKEIIYVYLTKYQIKYWFYFFAYQDIKYLIDYPIPIYITEKERVIDLYEIIENNIIKKISKVIIDENKFLLNNFELETNQKKSKLNFHLHINSYHSKNHIYCDFCGSSLKKNNEHHCSFISRFKKNEYFSYIKSRISDNKPLILELDLLQYDLILGKLIQVNEDDKLNNDNKKNTKSKKTINLYDCFNLFKSEEKLEDDNMWYCNKCKKHQEVFKKMDIYKSPYYLIIQLKRFKHHNIRNSILGSIYSGDGKNSTYIEFPIKNLDLSSYVIGPESNNNIYDLIGITNHYGGISFGHYTAYCLNNGKWYEFNDESVSFIQNENDLISKAAYILFYKKRD